MMVVLISASCWRHQQSACRMLLYSLHPAGTHNPELTLASLRSQLSLVVKFLPTNPIAVALGLGVVDLVRKIPKLIGYTQTQN